MQRNLVLLVTVVFLLKIAVFDFLYSKYARIIIIIFL